MLKAACTKKLSVLSGLCPVGVSEANRNLEQNYGGDIQVDELCR